MFSASSNSLNITAELLGLSDVKVVGVRTNLSARKIIIDNLYVIPSRCSMINCSDRVVASFQQQGDHAPSTSHEAPLF